MNTTAKPLSVAAQLARLPRLPMKELWKLWDQHFPNRPNHNNRDFVESQLAYQIQAKAYGGVAPTTKQQLLRLGEAQSKLQRSPAAQVQLVPGAVLVREYGEREHRVTVLAANRFEYEGREFKSLSAIARFITGTQWSGPVFFGLAKTKRKSK